MDEVREYLHNIHLGFSQSKKTPAKTVYETLMFIITGYFSLGTDILLSLEAVELA